MQLLRFQWSFTKLSFNSIFRISDHIMTRCWCSVFQIASRLTSIYFLWKKTDIVGQNSNSWEHFKLCFLNFCVNIIPISPSKDVNDFYGQNFLSNF